MYCGTRIFAAPEVLLGQEQTPKVDVWSLFVTVVYAFNVNGFREKNWKKGSVREIIVAIQEAAQSFVMCMMEDMAHVQSMERASASQTLRKLFNEPESAPSNPW